MLPGAVKCCICMQLLFALTFAVRPLTHTYALTAGAACESGTYCYTGRADATGGYCRLIGGATGVAPAAAPASSASAPAPSVPSCTTAGTCPPAHSCMQDECLTLLKQVSITALIQVVHLLA